MQDKMHWLEGDRASDQVLMCQDIIHAIGFYFIRKNVPNVLPSKPQCSLTENVSIAFCKHPTLDTYSLMYKEIENTNL